VLYEVRLSGLLSFAESYNGCRESHIEYNEYIKCNACVIAVVSDQRQKFSASVNIKHSKLWHTFAKTLQAT